MNDHGKCKRVAYHDQLQKQFFFSGALKVFCYVQSHSPK